MISNIITLFVIQIAFAFVLGTSLGLAFPYASHKSMRFWYSVTAIFIANFALSNALSKLLL